MRRDVEVACASFAGATAGVHFIFPPHTARCASTRSSSLLGFRQSLNSHLGALVQLHCQKWSIREASELEGPFREGGYFGAQNGAWVAPAPSPGDLNDPTWGTRFALGRHGGPLGGALGVRCVKTHVFKQF